MKQVKRIACLFLSLVLALSCCYSGILIAHAQNPGKSYYVATNGDDANNGSLNAPFKTIQKATEVMAPGDTCYVREGVYHEEVKPAVNGKEGKPITITNYKDEKVVLSGCKQITGWTKDTGKEGVWKAPMNWSLADGYGNQVFSNGKLMWEARYPNVKPGDTMTNFTRAKTKNGSGLVSGNKDKSQLVDSDLIALFKDAHDMDGATIWNVPGAGWTALTSKVESYDPATGTMVYESTLRGKTKSYYRPGSGYDYFVFGSYGLLDAENEWWYNQNTQELYIKTPGGVNPDEAKLYVEAKEYESVLDLSGCSYVDVKGIDVRGSTVITDKDSSHILLKNMNMEYVGHNGSLVLNSLTSNACVQDDLGVLLKGSFITVDSCEVAYSSGPLINVQGSDNRVVNCFIHDGDYIGSYCGHTKLSGRRQFISNNTMTDSGRDTVSFRDLQESVVQYNDISGSARLTKDVGIMYSANTDGQNTLIHHNYIHDSFNPTTTNDNGLYPDEMTHNFIIFNNVIWNVKSNAMCLNQPSLYNLVYNNTGFNKGSVSDQYQASFYDSTGRQYINNFFSNKGTGSYDPQDTWNYNNGSSDKPGFADTENGKFMIGNDSALAGAGIKINGVTGLIPSLGAYEPGQKEFVVGHNFKNPPVILAAPSVEQFEFRNLIKNGGFEYGTLEGWKGEGEVVFEDSWHSRNKIPATCTHGLVMQPGQNITQTVKVQPNTTYTLGFNTRSGSGSKVTYGVTGMAAGDLLETADNKSGSWSGSTKKYLEFTTGAKDTEIVITISNAGENEMYVDDIGMQKAVEFIGELSVPVSYELDEATGKTKVTFENLPEGHRYFINDATVQERNIKAGGLLIPVPKEYSTELKSGMLVDRKSFQYLNIVEVVGNDVVGAGSLAINYNKVQNLELKDIQDAFGNRRKGDVPQHAVPNPENPADMANTRYYLHVGYGSNGYLQFSLKGLDSRRIKSAQVQFYVYATGSSTSKRSFSVSAASSNDWKEDTLTTNNAPSTGKKLGNTESIGKITAPDGKLLSVDITEYTKECADAGDLMSLVLQMNGWIWYGGENYIASKENPTYGAFAPKLVVEYYDDAELEAAREKLQNLYDECGKLDQKNFTEETWNKLTESMEAAKKVLDNADATQAELEEAYNNLLAAKNGLHQHALTHVEAKEATCTEAGNKEHWVCSACGKYFADAEGKTEITDVTIPAAGHKLTHVEAKEATVTEEGNKEYWVCSVCGKYFGDAEGKTEIEKDSVILEKLPEPDIPPQTGDALRIALMGSVALLILAGAAVAVTLSLKRKNG